VLQVQDGESRVLMPDMYAEAAFRTPSWVTAERVRHSTHCGSAAGLRQL
jgi:hypothetical protein